MSAETTESTGFTVLASALAEPFLANEIEWRVQSSGKSRNGTPWVRVLAYVTNRAIMDRLDTVCGIDGWQNAFTHAPSGAVLCGLSLRIGSAWITKWDGANETDIEAAKGGISNAMKRAAVQWGIGRYLYHLEEGFASVVGAEDRTANFLKENPNKHGAALKWRPPVLPEWALPGGTGKPTPLPPIAERALSVPTTQTTPKADTPSLTTTGPGVIKLPGTKAHFDGHGGKRIADVPVDALLVIRQVLEDRNGEGRYTTAINAIVAHLEALRTD